MSTTDHVTYTYLVYKGFIFLYSFNLDVIYVSRQAKRDLLGVKIENRFFAYGNSLIFHDSEHVRYKTLSQL